MKGVIYNITPDTQIVDITHEIPVQDVCTGSIALWHAVSEEGWQRAGAIQCAPDPEIQRFLWGEGAVVEQGAGCVQRFQQLWPPRPNRVESAALYLRQGDRNLTLQPVVLDSRRGKVISYGGGLCMTPHR